MADKKKNVRRFYALDKAFIRVLLTFIGKPLMKSLNAEVEPYVPKNDTFIIVSNHSNVMDPGYQMISLDRYIRYVATDYLLRANFLTKFLLGTLDGVIVKRREMPSSVLVEEILENLKAGIPVGLHAEGMLTTNGETGFVSEHTGQLIKESGAALITYRITGGYLRRPRWANIQRTGIIRGRVVAEYDPEDLASLSVEEITDLIRRDIYVNAFEEQKKNPCVYKGEKLAEHAERLLFICPKCGGVATMHSAGDKLTCECGYELTYGEDGFWHSDKNDVIFDNDLDWDRWQREEWKKIVLAKEDFIISEDDMLVYKVVNNERTLFMSGAVISLYKDRIELKKGGESLCLPLGTLKRVQIPSKQNLAIIDGANNYYIIARNSPWSSAKYLAAWYYLNGKDYK